MADYHAFLPLPTTAPGFLTIASSTGSVYRLESSATNRLWGSPTNRWIRITGLSTDVWVSFGTTAATDLAVQGSHMLLQMPGDHVLPILASKPGISLIVDGAGVGSTQVFTVLGTVVEY